MNYSRKWSVFLGLTAFSLLSVLHAFAASGPGANPANDPSDPCLQKAIKAAQAQYGLDPYRTTIRTIVEGRSYKVTVGIGNPESGEDLFDVTFPDGCDSTPDAVEAPEVPINLLQTDADAAYTQLIHDGHGNIASSYEVTPDELPAKAQALYAERAKNLAILCKQWSQEDGKTVELSLTVYKVEVDGKDTFGIFSPNEHDSIRAYLSLVDGRGNDIDQASLYNETDVGQGGVSWQHESVQK